MEGSTQAVTNDIQENKRSRSRRKNVKLDFDSLMEKLETRQKGLKHVDKSFDWIIQHFRQSKSQSCFCQGFEDEVSGLKECRQIFREQILSLKDEVDLHHRRCEDQMALETQEVIRVKKKCTRSVEKVRNQSKDTKKTIVENKMTDLHAEKMYLDRNQKILDGEEDLLDRAEALTKGRKQLEELEKELEEAEALLQKRQIMCDRKHEDLINLHQELKELRLELGGHQSETSEKAQRNWEILRRDLQDRHKLLECNIQKYRTELASASAIITGKDIHINKLQEQISELNRIIDEKDQRMKNLESRLAMALTESVRTDQKYFNQWRQKRGSLRADSMIDEVSNFSSADDSLPNSPSRFLSRPQFQRNSLKNNNFGLASGSPEKHHSLDGYKLTDTTIHHNLHLNNEGEETLPFKSNSSSACILM